MDIQANGFASAAATDTPAIPQLPTDRQLRLLHIRGVIGYSTRCVRRARRHYSSSRIGCVEAIDYALFVGQEFAEGRHREIKWKELETATLYADDTTAESVAMAACKLTSAISNAQMASMPGGLPTCVIRYAYDAIETAYDACFTEEFVQAAQADFFEIEKMSPQRYPAIGPAIDMDTNGKLGPVWPIWESVPTRKPKPR